MVALHAALLVGCWVEPIALRRPLVPALEYPMIALVVAANALRWWCIGTLGPRWTARVMVLPGLPLVNAGPYRWFAHPNYVAVVVEGAALPLAGSAWITACVFTACNAALLRVRLRCETRRWPRRHREERGGRRQVAGGPVPAVYGMSRPAADDNSRRRART